MATISVPPLCKGTPVSKPPGAKKAKMTSGLKCEKKAVVFMVDDKPKVIPENEGMGPGHGVSKMRPSDHTTLIAQPAA